MVYLLIGQLSLTMTIISPLFSELMVSTKLNGYWYVCRATGEKDVKFKVLYCGICHSDLHMILNEWGMTTYPLIPGYVNVSYFYHCIFAFS